ncbi:energy transducer TonB [Pseudoxanthomonas wuyuanensis]|uniref:Protein TonB n=1 Tax=Pseudoxanthomonas wuyuanensis TaxID=1073196 RepID=A0A286DEX0_9GAMM|nr:energy transducer TonB [Pseudoxanthomonas wuyuanensis]KAF1719882.1 energy transducer TonB [Pseudoxanthomonas wuyuanensis]SOD57113.1 outer membrane transport energization protein TonB [Pseudoxanthomonas wuyuanensis]
MLFSTISGKSRRAAPLLLIAALAACSKDEPAAEAPAPVAGQPAAAPAAEPPPAVSAQVQAMSADELRQLATNALRENRIYAPGGDNAMEYYLALRDKAPTDPGVTSALTDLMPYTLIAAEQSIAREEFDEAQRLSALIEKTDPAAPALPRLKQSIATAQQAVAQRAVASEALAEQQARQQEQQRLAQQAEQQRAAEAQAAQQLAAQQEAAARAESERQAAAQREAQQRAEREAAARNTATAATTAAAPSAATLRAVSTPAPRYPPEALRSGTSGEVLVEITVGTDGSVTAARVVRANPARVFDREALNAVRRWKFEPVDAPVTTRRTIGFNPG